MSELTDKHRFNPWAVIDALRAEIAQLQAQREELNNLLFDRDHREAFNLNCETNQLEPLTLEMENQILRQELEKYREAFMRSGGPTPNSASSPALSRRDGKNRLD